MSRRHSEQVASLSTLRRTYASCFAYLSVAGFAAIAEYAVVAYDGEPYRFIVAGAMAIIIAALGAAIAAPVIARFDGNDRDRKMSVRSWLGAIALGTVFCLPLSINHAVRAVPVGR